MVSWRFQAVLVQLTLLASNILKPLQNTQNHSRRVSFDGNALEPREMKQILESNKTDVVERA